MFSKLDLSEIKPERVSNLLLAPGCKPETPDFFFSKRQIQSGELNAVWFRKDSLLFHQGRILELLTFLFIVAMEITRAN